MLVKREDMTMIGRLKRRSDFLRVGASGQKWVSPTVIIQIADSPVETPAESATESPASGPHYGLTVTKKTEKTSVGRNRIKRRLRAAMASALTGEHADLKCTDIVVIGRAAAEKAPFDQLVKDIRWCLRRLRGKQAEKTQ
ncbi:ribonuclease P protein component [Micavibrio aeruginosavorus]|uniref:ribonuclease P protein component n=1 Tax=Micavibrio aeruginosavorus TaxID=349221 RepID=UPI003F4ACCA6